MSTNAPKHALDPNEAQQWADFGEAKYRTLDDYNHKRSCGQPRL